MSCLGEVIAIFDVCFSSAFSAVLDVSQYHDLNYHLSKFIYTLCRVSCRYNKEEKKLIKGLMGVLFILFLRRQSSPVTLIKLSPVVLQTSCQKFLQQCITNLVTAVSRGGNQPDYQAAQEHISP